MTYKETNEFLESFKSDLYNKLQIGSNKQTISSIYEFLDKLGISKDNIEKLIKNIAYLNQNHINLPLYLELLSKSLGYITEYALKDIINVTKEIHDIYYHHSPKITLEDYLHDFSGARLKKIFLNRNNKYINKNFEAPEMIDYVSDLKLAAAIALDSKNYKFFINYIDNFEDYKASYSPILMFKQYFKVRKHLKDKTLIFWDILFGNEYIVALNKNNIDIKDICQKNVFNKTTKSKQTESQELVQLDLFTYQDETMEESTIPNEIKSIQICTIYNATYLPNFTKEQDIVSYYKNVLNSKEMIVLPKLKKESNAQYIYETK